MTTTQDGGKAVSLTHRPHLPQEINLLFISVTGLVDLMSIVPPEGLCHGKIPVTPLGIEPSTCRFVAYALTTTPPRAPKIQTLKLCKPQQM